MSAGGLSLLPGCALHRVRGERDDVLTALAEAVIDHGHAEASLTGAVIAREHRYPTGLPTPVPAAIPHTDAEHVRDPGLAVATLAVPVPFGVMGTSGDEQLDVELVVLLCVTDPSAQVGGLQQVLARLGDADSVRTIVEHADPDSFEAAVTKWLTT